MNKATSEVLQSLGNTISVSRRARAIKQADLALSAGIGMNTMVAIEKGAPTVQIRHYLEVMDTLGLLPLLKPVTEVNGDKVAVESMVGLLPKRVTGKRRNH